MNLFEYVKYVSIKEVKRVVQRANYDFFIGEQQVVKVTAEGRMQNRFRARGWNNILQERS